MDAEIFHLRKMKVKVQQEIDKKTRSNSFNLGEVGYKKAVNLDSNSAKTPMKDDQPPANTQIEPTAKLETPLTMQTENLKNTFETNNVKKLQVPNIALLKSENVVKPEIVDLNITSFFEDTNWVSRLRRITGKKSKPANRLEAHLFDLVSAKP